MNLAKRFSLILLLIGIQFSGMAMDRNHMRADPFTEGTNPVANVARGFNRASDYCASCTSDLQLSTTNHASQIYGELMNEGYAPGDSTPSTK